MAFLRNLLHGLVTTALLGACRPGATSGGELLEPVPAGEKAVAETSGPNAPNEPNEPAAPPAPRPGAYANTDPDDDFVVGPPERFDECETLLAKEGVTYRRAELKVHTTKKKKIVCGAPQVVLYLKGPGNIAYSAPPLLTCKMALALAWFEKLVQEEAKAHLNARVVRIDHLGTYSCREMAAYPGWVSEHSYANAIDLARFVLSDGRTISVVRDFDTGEGTPKTAAGRFLRTISRRANDEDVFSHVLTPFFDAHHRDHFHLDLARYRTDGTRPQ